MWSWSAFVLPFMEASNIYNTINWAGRPWVEERGDAWFFDQGPDATAAAALNRLVSTQMPPSFACPSTPQPNTGRYKDYAHNGGHGPSGAVIVQRGGTRINSCCPERATVGSGIGHKHSYVKIALAHRWYLQHLHDARTVFDDSQVAIPNQPVLVDEPPIARLVDAQSRRCAFSSQPRTGLSSFPTRQSVQRRNWYRTGRSLLAQLSHRRHYDGHGRR